MNPWAVAIAAGGLGLGPLLEWAVTSTIAGRGLPVPSAGARRATSAALGLATALLLILVVLRLGMDWIAAPAICLCGGLIGLAWCDLRHFVLPKRIQHPMTTCCLLSLVVAAAVTGEWHRLVVAAVCAAVSYGLFLSLNLINPAALGFGDVRLSGSVGLVLGWLALARVELGFVVTTVTGAAAAIALLVVRGQKGDRLPYGVFLALGAVFALVA